MDLSVGECELCFVVTSSPPDKDSGERSRAHGPSCCCFFLNQTMKLQLNSSFHMCYLVAFYQPIVEL